VSHVRPSFLGRNEAASWPLALNRASPFAQKSWIPWRNWFITLALAGRDIATEVRAFAQRNAGKATRMSVGDVLERSESV
jgi:hypothetical protein